LSENKRLEATDDAPDPDALTTATVGIAGSLLVIIVVVFVQGLYERMNRAEFDRKVVAEIPGEIRNLRAAQLTRLNATGWVDKTNGYVQIPIERAMELLASDPNPAAPIVLPAAAAAPAPAATVPPAAAPVKGAK